MQETAIRCKKIHVPLFFLFSRLHHPRNVIGAWIPTTPRLALGPVAWTTTSFRRTIMLFLTLSGCLQALIKVGAFR